MALIPPHYLDAVVAIGVGDDPEERKWIGTGVLLWPVIRRNRRGQNRYFICLTKVWRIRNYSRDVTSEKSGRRSLPQQGKLSRHRSVGGHQSVKVGAASQGPVVVVPAIPVEAVAARPPEALAQDRHPLPGQGKQFHPRWTGRQQEEGDEGLAVEWIGDVLVQLDVIRQPDQLLCHH